MPERPSIRFIAQKGSPLGTHRHVRCVVRRLQQGLPGAFAAQESYFLTPEALEEELAAPKPKPRSKRRGVKLTRMQRELVGVRFMSKVR